MSEQHALVRALVDAVSTPSDEHLAALRPFLAADVRARGLFVSGSGADEVLEAIRSSQPPVLTMATYGEPRLDGDTATIRGALPDGLPIGAVLLELTVRGSELVGLVQTIEEAAQPASVGIDLDDTVAEFVASSFERGAPLVLAYVDGAGTPRLSYRGTIQVYDSQSLGLWVRNPRGGFLQAIEANPHVSIIGSDHASRTHYEFVGRARVVTDPAVRAAIYDASPKHEQDIDAGARGVAVLIEVDELRGGSLGAMVHQRRSAP